MEDITNADQMHANRVCKDFEIKTLGKYWLIPHQMVQNV